MKTTRKHAGELHSGYTVHLASGRSVPITGTFGTGDGTITLFFDDGVNVWGRRVDDNMILEVSPTPSSPSQRHTIVL